MLPVSKRTTVPVRVFRDADTLGEALAADVLRRYERSTDAFLLGCPGGRSLRSTYRVLAQRDADLSRVVIVMMDDYVRGGVRVQPHEHYSCEAFARTEIAGPIGIPEERVWLPDPLQPAAYDERIAAAGGIDLFLLASGASDGHIGFVGPNALSDGSTAVVALAESTRRDNLVTFPAFRSLDEVPRHGVSVGLGTVSRLSRAVRLVLHGADKAAATSRLLACDGFDPSWPASIVNLCEDAEIWLDEAALGRR
jgi:glucosamine-6-phosphate deaminase